MDLVYLDSNATTRPDPAVVDAVLRYLRDDWGNPNSVHLRGQRARAAIDESRARVARLLSCRDSEIIFTGGGTEATCTALRGLWASRRDGATRIVTSPLEHSATRATCATLARDGAEIVEVPVDEGGLLDMDALAEAVDERAAAVTLLWANNETGVLFDVPEIARLCRERGVRFHCDATQAVGKIPLDFHEAGFDCATLAAHKFHGPKGVGALYIRRGVRVAPLITGGPQEREKRGGTENVPGIVGMGVAADLAAGHLEEMDRVVALRDEMERRILETIDDCRINGDREHRLPNTSNIGFARLGAEAILLMLSERGICASAGAACSSGSLEASHVLRGMGIPEIYAHGSIRLSLSRFTTHAEIDRLLEVLPEVVERLRAVLPVM